MIESLEDNPQGAALSWLLEMEVVANPMVLDTLIMNIGASVKGIQDLQFVIDEKNKKILVYVEPTKYYGRFFKRQILTQVTEMISQILPSFEKRVTLNRDLLDRAIKILKNQ
jgi:hypothetical protein